MKTEVRTEGDNLVITLDKEMVIYIVEELIPALTGKKDFFSVFPRW